MATEVLRHMRPLPAFLPRRKPNTNPHTKPSRKTPSPRPAARKRREGSPKPKTDGAIVGESRSMAGRVTILKRGGDSLDMFKKPERSPVFETECLGPDPKIVQKHIRFGDLKTTVEAEAATVKTYAGSGFSMSPSPSSLPLPSFSVKKDESPVVDYATKNLRRLLRLE